MESVFGNLCLQYFSDLHNIIITHLPPPFNPALPALLRLPSRSILYKTRLPLIVAFNKSDVTPHDFALEWMEDFESFQVSTCCLVGNRLRVMKVDVEPSPLPLWRCL
jgi:hypothetical protein